MKLTIILAACLAACVAGGAVAAPWGYALDFFGTLKYIDLNGPTVNTIGWTGVGNGQMQGLAIDGSNQLYATDIAGTLYSLGSSGSATPIANPGLGSLYGLDWHNGNLITVDSHSMVWDITTAGAPIPIVQLNLNLPAVEAIAVGSNNNAYILTASSGGTDFSEIDLGTGMVQYKSTIPAVSRGLDFAADGKLYALAYAGVTYEINPGTGAWNQTVYTGKEDWVALACPVPEPGLLSLLGLGGLLILRRSGKPA